MTVPGLSSVLRMCDRVWYESNPSRLPLLLALIRGGVRWSCDTILRSRMRRARGIQEVSWKSPRQLAETYIEQVLLLGRAPRASRRYGPLRW